MGEHTKWWRRGEETTTSVEIVDGDNQLVAIVRGSVLHGTTRTMSANADVMIAAPELLGALERVEREARRLHVDDILDLTAARAAIAKARGTP